MADIYLSLGSNIDPENNLTTAIKLLSNRYPIIRVSSFFQTIPWGFQQQSFFFNCAVHFKSTEKPKTILSFTQKLERYLNRKRLILNGPRTIDIDILLYDNIIINSLNLTLPHPGLTKRDFMLVPVLELAPYIRSPYNESYLSEYLVKIKFHQIFKQRQKNIDTYHA